MTNDQQIDLIERFYSFALDDTTYQETIKCGDETCGLR